MLGGKQKGKRKREEETPNKQGGDGGVTLVHRSMAEMGHYLQSILPSAVFTLDILDLVLEYMRNLRLLLLFNPRSSVYRFRAVWYNVLDESLPLVPLSDRVHVSCVQHPNTLGTLSVAAKAGHETNSCIQPPNTLGTYGTEIIANARSSNTVDTLMPETAANAGDDTKQYAEENVRAHKRPRRRVNRASEVRKRVPLERRSAKEKEKARSYNYQELYSAEINVEPRPNIAGTQRRSFALLRFANEEISVRSMTDLDRAYPTETLISVSDRREIDDVHASIGGNDERGKPPHVGPLARIIDGCDRLLFVRRHDGLAVWDRIERRIVWHDDRVTSSNSRHLASPHHRYRQFVLANGSEYVLELKIPSFRVLHFLRVEPSVSIATRQVVPQWIEAWDSKETAAALEMHARHPRTGIHENRSAYPIGIICSTKRSACHLAADGISLVPTIRHRTIRNTTAFPKSESVVFSKSTSEALSKSGSADFGAAVSPATLDQSDCERMSGRSLLILSGGIPRCLYVYDLLTAQKVDELCDLFSVLGYDALAESELNQIRRRPYGTYKFMPQILLTRWRHTLVVVGFHPTDTQLRIRSFRWVSHDPFHREPFSHEQPQLFAAAESSVGSNMPDCPSVVRISPIDIQLDISKPIADFYRRCANAHAVPINNIPLLSRIETLEAGRFLLVRFRAARCTDKIYPHLDLCIDLVHSRVDDLGDLGDFDSISVCNTY